MQVNYVSEIANGRVLNLELYTHRRQKLILLHLFTCLFRKEVFLTLRNRCMVLFYLPGVNEQLS